MYKIVIAILFVIAIVIWGAVLLSMQQQRARAQVEGRVLILCNLQSDVMCDANTVMRDHWDNAVFCSELYENYTEQLFKACMESVGVPLTPKP